MQLDECSQVLRVGEAAAAGAGPEARCGLARDAAEQDVLVLAVARAFGVAEEEDVVLRQMRRRRRDRQVEGLVRSGTAGKIA